MSTHIERARAIVRGAVQGVGFRPFVYRLASQLDLRGWVSNSAQGVFIEVEGPGASLRQFLVQLDREKPPRAIIQSLEFSFLDATGYKDFTIRESEEKGAKTTLILPDIATCAHCLMEISQTSNRRYRYPFTNCTNCGPRFSIIEALPYDRAEHLDEEFQDVSALRARIQRPERSPVPRAAQWVPQLRPAPRALGHGWQCRFPRR